MDDDAFFQDLIDAVRQQLESTSTPYVAKAYDKLLRRGLEPDEALELLAEALAEETDAMYRRRTGFDEKSYRDRLEAL